MRRAARTASMLALGWLMLWAPLRAEYLYTADFSNAAQAVLARRYVDARTAAEAMLERDPGSFEAHAILGQVHLRGEEDLGLAELHLNQARRLLEERYPLPLDENGPLALHQQILRDLRQTAYLREQYAQSLSLLDEYNRLYDPDLDHLRGWQLLKLGRFAEAKTAVEKAQAALAEDDPRQAELGDTLGQLAYESGELAEAEEHFLAASTLEADTAEQPDPVYLTNLGEAYRDQLLFDQAESAWLEAAGFSHPGTYAEPHQRLACLYAGSARWTEALEQLEQCLAWRAELWPQVAAHTRASHLTSVGEVMLALGESRPAAEVLRRALAEPNRQALSSGRTGVALAKRYTLYAEALELEAEKARESQSWLSGSLWWEAGKRAIESRVVAAWARSQASVVLAQGGLENALEPYGPGAMECPWLLSEVAQSLGPGPTRLALRAMPKKAAGTSIEAYIPYRAMLRAGGSSGTFATGSSSGSDSATAISPSETLARAALLLTEGKVVDALRLDRQVTRRQGVPLGITVESSPELGEMLLDSPRFHSGGDLKVAVAADRSAIVTDSRGAELARTGPNPDLPSLNAAIHRALFSVPLDGWTPSRLATLTREPSPGRMASARLQSLLGDE